jgi:predicted nucleic-acid-binding Zn-ribbon protein
VDAEERIEVPIAEDAPRCPKCGGPMDRGRVCQIGGQNLEFVPSKALRGSAYPDSGNACLDCGFVEMYVNPQELRASLAGVKFKKPFFG